MYKVGIIGVGNMGEAILRSMLSSGTVSKEEVVVFDINRDRMESILENYNVKTANSEEEIVKNSKYIFLAIKPKDYRNLLEKTKTFFSNKKVVISLLAGVKIEKIKEIVGDIPIVRIMPNTPVIVGEGAIGISFDNNIEDKEKEELKGIFSNLGETVYVSEELLDVVTGLSGSGPAYVFLFIDALAQGGVKMGLSYDDALRLAVQTVLGSAKMIKELKEHPAILRDKVTSPAGTTIYGISALESLNFRSSVIKAVEEATKRSKELSNL